MFYSPLEKDSYEEDSQILRIFFVAVLFKWAVSISMQSKELDDESEEGFVGARYAVARIRVPDRASDAAHPPDSLIYPILFRFIPVLPVVMDSMQHVLR